MKSIPVRYFVDRVEVDEATWQDRPIEFMERDDSGTLSFHRERVTSGQVRVFDTPRVRTC